MKEIGATIERYREKHECFPDHFSTIRKLTPFASTQIILGMESDYRSSDIFRCPSDQLAFEANFAMSYCWNTGPGLENTDWNGFFSFMGHSLSPDDFVDGCSNTAAVSETRIFDVDSPNPKRQLWRVGRFYPKLNEMHLRAEDRQNLIRDCICVPQVEGPSAYSKRGTEHDLTETYSHLLTPNLPSCESTNADESVKFEILTANSEHPNGVHLLLADGHVQFISDEYLDRAGDAQRP